MMNVLRKTIVLLLCGGGFIGVGFAAPSKPLGQGFDLKKVNVPSQPSNGVASGAAQGLGLLQIVGVASSSYARYEYLGSNSRSTSQVHNGAIEVAVLQYGYGNTQPASLNGAAPMRSKTVTFCGSLRNLHTCRAGEKLSAWLYFYQFEPSQGGYFTMSANSTAAPFGTAKVSLSIKAN
ncbi:YolA family protein [Shewanella sp. C32]|uniref:YolA family protein n=1 Tax=Shewanella electrica TaxID=515560 RepID=A0ABT2FRY0_9GAMM|nr:DUF4879 domain-containing protein [Shewanella electrica]MCH1926814.1 YolA family protein [Shewanella electrica]MCS4558375.1 YolA family protein [Shewanella electrica]